MGQSKWTAKVPPGSREITGPKIVVIRDRDSRYGDKPKPIPAGQVLLEERSGSLRIVFCMEGLTLYTSKGGNEFQSGVGFRYSQGCEVLVDVFPRGHETKYKQWQKDLGEPTAFIPRINSPVVTSHPALVRPSGAERPGQGGDYTKILSVPELETYLKANLPLLGVAKGDVPTVIRHVEKLIRDGQAEAVRKAKQLEQKRSR